MLNRLKSYKYFSPTMIVIVACIISLPTLLPLFRNGFFTLHDYTHVARLVEMKRAIDDGHFPVRWSQNLGYGYGMPQFNFYAPLFYYLAYVFVLLGFNTLISIKIILALLTIAGFVGFYYLVYWLFKQSYPALLAATVFTYAPYRAVDFYVRGAFGELLAITALVFVGLALVGIYRFRTTKAWLGFSLSLTMLLLSHNLVSFIAAPFIGIALVFAVFEHKEWKQFWFYPLLGVAMAAFYVIPAFYEKRYTQVDSLTGGFSDFHHHFLYLRQLWHSPWAYGGSIFGLADDMSFELGKMFLVLAVLGSAWLIRHNKYRFLGVVVGGLFVLSLLMTTFKTQWFWEQISLMAFVQFPWRYLSISIVLLPVLVAPFVLWLPKRLVPILTSGLIIVVIFSSWWRFTPKEYLANAEILFYEDAQKIQKHMSSVIPDFLPVQVDPLRITPPKERYVFTPLAKSTQPFIERTHEFYVEAEIATPTIFQANINYFPGWRMYIDGKAVPIKVDEESGLMHIRLDNPGKVRISGVFENTPTRTFSHILSILAFAGWMYLFLPKRLPDSKET
jgi:hypothetical protein